MDQQYLQSLHATLEQISAPTGGTEGIKNATKSLNERFYKSPQAIPGLYEILSTSTNPSVRQLAAVELRKRVAAAKNKHWKRLSAQHRSVIKAGLLTRVLAEEVPITRHGIARVIAEIADVELAAKSWPELLIFINTASGSPNPAEREVAVFTLYAVLDYVVELFSEHLPQIYALFQKSLQDPESLEVRVTTVQALGKVAEYIDADETESIAIFQAMVPAIIQVIGQTLTKSDEAAAKKVFDTLETLLILEVPLLSPTLGQVVEFLANAGGNRQLDDDLRIMALNSLLWTIKFKKSRVAALDLTKPIVDALITIGAEDEPEDPDDDSVARTAFRCLDTLATSHAPGAVFPPLYQRIRECAQNPDPTLRKSSIMALGVAVEGCSLYIQPHLDQVWPFIDNGLQDQDLRVRKAACTALACLCDMLGSDCAKRHAVLMPLLTACLNDPASQRQAMTALDALVEALEQGVVALYLHDMMERLLPMLEHTPNAMRGTVVGVISSAAYSAKAAFAPYFGATMQRVTPFLALTEEGEEQELRGITQDAVGTFAQAVGKEQFRPYLQPSLQIAFEALNLDSAQMRECSILFFGVLSKVYGEEFIPFMPQIMPPLLASLGQGEEDGEEVDGSVAKLAGQGFKADDDEEAEEEGFVDIDDMDSDDEEFLKVTTAIAVEKAVAADAVSEVFEHTKQAFVPYLEKSVKLLVELMSHYYPPSRKAAATTLLGFISTLHSLTNPPEVVPGLANISLRPEVSKLIELVVPEILTAWQSDDDVDVVADIATAFSSCITSVGIGVIAPDHLDAVCTFIIQILERKAPCQLDGDEVEESSAATGELSEAESTAIACAADLVGTLATVLGPDFTTAFGQFLPHLLPYTDAAKFSASDRANTIGAIAEVINGLGPAISTYTEQLLPVCMTLTADTDPEVRSNAAFMTGSLVFWSEVDLSSQYMPILGRLQPYFTVPEGASNQDKLELAKDNAAGAVARLILKNKAALPQDQVLPVFFAALPLRRDFAEWPKCLDAIYNLFQEQNPAVQAHFDHLLDVFAQALAPAASEDAEAPLNDESRARLLEFLRSLRTQAPDQLAKKGLDRYL